MSSVFKQLKKRSNQARLHEVNQQLAQEGKTLEDLDNPALIKRIKTAEKEIIEEGDSESSNSEQKDKESV